MLPYFNLRYGLIGVSNYLNATFPRRLDANLRQGF